MAELTVRTLEHSIELNRGQTGTIEFRFPKDARRVFTLTLAAADPKAGTAELVLDNLTRGYEMWRYTEGAAGEPWNPLLPDAGGEVRAQLHWKAGERIAIISDDQRSHSLQMIGADGRGDRLRLVFRETA